MSFLHFFCSHCTTGAFVSQNYPIIMKFHMYTLSLQLDYKFLECRECALHIFFSYAYNNSRHVSIHLRFKKIVELFSLTLTYLPLVKNSSLTQIFVFNGTEISFKCGSHVSPMGGPSTRLDPQWVLTAYIID